MTKAQTDEAETFKGKVATTYVDFQSANEKCRKLCQAFACQWQLLICQTLETTVAKITEGDQEANINAAFKTLQEEAFRLTKEMEAVFWAHLHDEIDEAHHLGYSEGVSAAYKECTRSLNDLIEDGFIHDDGAVSKFIDFINDHSIKFLEEQTKGRSLNVYRARTKDEESKK